MRRQIPQPTAGLLPPRSGGLLQILMAIFFTFAAVLLGSRPRLSSTVKDVMRARYAAARDVTHRGIPSVAGGYWHPRSSWASWAAESMCLSLQKNWGEVVRGTR